MIDHERVLAQFKSLLGEKIPLDRMILFGSRARGDAESRSDADVILIVRRQLNEQEQDHVSDCAWEAGYRDGLVVVPLVFTKEEWDEGPERASLLHKAVDRDGVLV